MRKFSVLLLFSILLSCNKKKIFDGPNAYADGFEHYSVIDSLIDGDDVRWSYFQNTFAGNVSAIDSSRSHSGIKSVRCFAEKSTAADGASKCSFTKQKMAFWENEIMVVEAWYFIEGTDKADWLFLMDLEEQANIGAGPGMRLALVDDKIRVEHKYNNPDILQSGDEILLPRNQWVHLKFETKLHQKKKGYVRVWQDDVLIIEQDNWNTLPRDLLYFQQGTKGMYSSVEFGITANSRDNDLVLFVDDVRIYKRD
ncbi:MAG: heparin lyase I family protein [Bacteroidia bacterium]